MTVEQALQELKKYANEFTSIGDANISIKNNKKEFIHRWIKVMQYFYYIWDNGNFKSEKKIEAFEVVDDIGYVNPSLGGWIDLIIEPKLAKKESKMEFESTFLSNKIESLVHEVQTMQFWDTDKVGDIEWQLQECQKQLIDHKIEFDPHVYDSLMNDINISLNKIDKFNKMVVSDAINRM